MSKNKTQPTKQSVTAFVKAIEDSQMRVDVKQLLAMMRKLTGARARMWGSSIVGFGEYHYKYASGREGDHLLIGCSPRKTALTIYIMAGFSNYTSLMKKLGKYKTGRSCLYVKKLSDVDEKVLLQLMKESVAYMRKNYDTK